MQIRLIVPTHIADNTPDVDAIACYGPAIAAIAGGFTTFQATGGWTDELGKLIVEPVTVFDVHIHVDYLADNASAGWRSCGPIVRLTDLAARIARELNQTCVYLSFDGQVEYVKPSVCPQCDGTGNIGGEVNGSPIPCPACSR